PAPLSRRARPARHRRDRGRSPAAGQVAAVPAHRRRRRQRPVGVLRRALPGRGAGPALLPRRRTGLQLGRPRTAGPLPGAAAPPAPPPRDRAGRGAHRGRGPARHGPGRHRPRAARPGAVRGALRARGADLRGDRARRRRHRRPGARGRAARQGGQAPRGAGGAIRPRGARGVSHARQARPGGARNGDTRDLPGLPRHPADQAGRLAGGAARRGRRRAERSARADQPPHPAPLVRHAPAARGSGRAGRAGAARPRLGHHHAAVHPGHRRLAARDPCGRPPPCPERGLDLSGTTPLPGTAGSGRPARDDDGTAHPSLPGLGSELIRPPRGAPRAPTRPRRRRQDTDVSPTSSQQLDIDLGPTGRPMPELPEPAPLDGHGPARIIVTVSEKRGVGQTTSVINLGAALPELGRRVLLVDLDPQGALSAGTGVNPYDLDVTVYNLLMERGHDVRSVIQETHTDNLDVLPANIDLSAAEVTLVNEVAREMALARVLRPVADEYDVIIIDCQPSLGLLTVNALAASHGVIIPLEAEYFA